MSGAGKKYIVIWGWLTALTLVEIFVATAPIPKLAIVSSLLAMSAWKALLVALYFMHLKFESRWLIAAAAVPAVIVAMTVLLLLTDTPFLS